MIGSLWPSELTAKRAALTLIVNQYKSLGLGKTRGCHEVLLSSGPSEAAKTALRQFDQIMPYLGSVEGKRGLEIGPGDNVALAQCFLANGANQMFAVDRYPTVRHNNLLKEIVNSHFGSRTTKEPNLCISAFEVLKVEAFDFIYSIDVIEHVSDVTKAFEAVSRMLKPGGRTIHSVDFAGHNAFEGTQLGFLTCPDWLWLLFHSNLVTTNRVRYGELLSAIELSELRIDRIDVLVHAEDVYIDRLRPRMLVRYKSLPKEDLRVLQAMVVSTKV